jgi:hypothetical protein
MIVLVVAAGVVYAVVSEVPTATVKLFLNVFAIVVPFNYYQYSILIPPAPPLPPLPAPAAPPLELEGYVLSPPLFHQIV